MQTRRVKIEGKDIGSRQQTIISYTAQPGEGDAENRTYMLVASSRHEACTRPDHLKDTAIHFVTVSTACGAVTEQENSKANSRAKIFRSAEVFGFAIKSQARDEQDDENEQSDVCVFCRTRVGQTTKQQRSIISLLI